MNTVKTTCSELKSAITHNPSLQVDHDRAAERLQPEAKSPASHNTSHRTQEGSHAGRRAGPRPFVLCRSGVVIAAVGETTVLVGAVLLALAHREPLELFHVVGDTLLVALVYYKLVKTRGKRNGRRQSKREDEPPAPSSDCPTGPNDGLPPAECLAVAPAPGGPAANQAEAALLEKLPQTPPTPSLAPSAPA